MGKRPPQVVIDLVNHVTEGLYAQSNKKKAREMAAYMKTDMPFFGVQKPQRVPVYRRMREFELTSRTQWKAAVLGLWKLPHREEKYAAIELAQMYPEYVDTKSIPLFKRLIREGAWWDFVDPVASWLVGTAYRNDRETVAEIMDAWIDDRVMWVRRAALISQLKHKEDTDHRRLFRYCLARADEKEFFIRKAIGWALREYSYAAPERVKAFLLRHQDELSGLSFREGAKGLVRKGLM